MHDLKEHFNAEKHPDVIHGNRLPDQVLVEFLETFETSLHVMERNSQDGKITWDEFMEYHHNLSFVFDDDQRFCQIVSNVWNVNS